MNIYVKIHWGSIGHAVLDCLGKDVMMMSGNVTMRTMSYISFLLCLLISCFFSSLPFFFFFSFFSFSSIWFLVELHDQGEYLLFIYLSIFFIYGKLWRLKTEIRAHATGFKVDTHRKQHDLLYKCWVFYRKED